MVPQIARVSSWALLIVTIIHQSPSILAFMPSNVCKYNSNIKCSTQVRRLIAQQMQPTTIPTMTSGFKKLNTLFARGPGRPRASDSVEDDADVEYEEEEDDDDTTADEEDGMFYMFFASILIHFLSLNI